MSVLDSCAIIEILDGTETGKKLKDQLGQEAVYTTAINLDEVLIGFTEKQQNQAWPFFALLEIIPFDDKAALQSVELDRALKKKGKPLSNTDRMIASMCISRGLQLITCDRDFKEVPGLKVKMI